MSPDEVRAVQLALLDEVDAFCRAHRIRYTLAYGTLLGAVRHQGYIPWDDYIDLTMSRPDYERFLATFTSESSEALRPGSQAWPFAHAKVCHRGSQLVEDIAVAHDLGVNIDIFPIEQHGGRWAAVRLGAARACTRAALAKSIALSKDRSRSKMVALAVLQTALRPVRARVLGRLADRLAAMPWRDGGIVGPVLVSNPWRVSIADAAATGSVTFEGRRFPAPAGTVAVLTAAYGPDFMQPPPASARRTHHLWTACWRPQADRA